jgi:hypothetical protein
MANKKKGEIEEQILTLMERIEKLQEEARQADVKAVEAERFFAQEKVKLEDSNGEVGSEESPENNVNKEENEMEMKEDEGKDKEGQDEKR